MKLRISHEPWNTVMPYRVDEIVTGPGAGEYLRDRFTEEAGARRYAEAYLRGPTVIAELEAAAIASGSQPECQ